jgi:acyl carrier protein
MMFRKQTPAIDGPLTHDSLRAWLVADLARRLRCAESEINTAKPFDAYGLDSRNAVQVSGVLGKVVGMRLSPAVLFDHETIDDLAAYLTRELRLPTSTGGHDPVHDADRS